MGKKNILEKTCLKYSPLCVQKFSTSRTDCGAISDRNYFVLRFSNTISLKIFRYISGIILISIRNKNHGIIGIYDLFWKSQMLVNYKVQ